MPFYEYECPKCKFYTEVLQKISDKPLKKCPSCGKAGFKRLVSAPVFRLKGSGWYETDFKSDKEGQRNLAGAEREEAAPSDSKAKSDDKAAATPAADSASAKSESKADSKAESKSDKDKSTAARAPERSSGRSSKSAAKPAGKSAAKPAAKRGVKRPAKATRRGKGRR
jgi:putative FmdB family regulatory protein